MGQPTDSHPNARFTRRRPPEPYVGLGGRPRAAPGRGAESGGGGGAGGLAAPECRTGRQGGAAVRLGAGPPVPPATTAVGALAAGPPQPGQARRHRLLCRFGPADTTLETLARVA